MKNILFPNISTLNCPREGRVEIIYSRQREQVTVSDFYASVAIKGAWRMAKEEKMFSKILIKVPGSRSRMCLKAFGVQMTRQNLQTGTENDEQNVSFRAFEEQHEEQHEKLNKRKRIFSRLLGKISHSICLLREFQLSLEILLFQSSHANGKRRPSSF
jgi:hypothetical protein